MESAPNTGRGALERAIVGGPSLSILQRIQRWIGLISFIAAAIAIGSSVVSGRPALTNGLLLLALALAAQLPLRRFFAVFGSLILWSFIWFVFSAFRGLGDNFGSENQINLVANVERWLFGGRLPSARLQGWFYDPSHPHWYDWFFASVYGSFFACSSIVAIVAMVKYRELFVMHIRVLTLMLALSCVLFAVIPTNPPWRAADSQAGETIDRAGYHFMERFRVLFLGSQDAAQGDFIEDNNILAAMPSVHFASTVLLFFLACRFGSRRWRVLTLAYTVSMGVGLVYLGEHYLLDVLAGLSLAALSWRIASTDRFPGRLPSRALSRVFRPTLPTNGEVLADIPSSASPASVHDLAA